METDYGEILCTAVDEIVSARLQGLQYDITKLCTIVDDTNSYQGKYIVSEGTARYEAFTTDNNLKKGNSVLVTIPNGDYSMQKTIKGRIAATDTTPFKYTSPLDTMISIKEDLLDINQPDWVSRDRGLVANYEGDSMTDVIYSVGATTKDSAGELVGSSGFTRLGVSADFKSLLSGFDVLSGSYGLKIIIYSESIKQPGVDKNVVYVLDFSSADMIGNPYQFEEFFSQEKVFDISYINKIKRIDVYFYQGNNFIDGNGESIPYLIKNNYGIELDTALQPDNLFVDNVKLYLGYDKNEFKDETLMIYTDNSLSYHYKHTLEENRKSMELRWIHKINENEFTLLQSKDIDNVNYFVKWYKYCPGWENIDKYARKDWQEIPSEYSKPMICDFDPNIEKQKEEIKVVGIIRDNNTVTIQDNKEPLEKAYFSNLLVFENEEQVPDTKTWDASSALQIRCEDNSEGNYYIYNQNGKINNQGIGQGYIRYLKAYFKGAEITNDIGTLDYIKWYIPKDKTMMIYTKDFGTENEGKPSPEAVLYKQVQYQVIERKPKSEANIDGKFEFTSSKQAYSISNQWNYQNSNNTVRCQISADGVVYEATEELRFGKSGTNGTNVTLVLEFDDNANALIAGRGNKLSVSAWMYNEEGSRTGFTESSSKKIEWNWYKRSDTNYMSIPNGSIGDRVIITSETDIVPLDNYFILQATYDGLTAYLPIPIKSQGTSFIEGAREIIYNHQGIPSYYNDAYNLYYYQNDQYKKAEPVRWEIKSKEVFNSKLTQGYLPTLRYFGNNNSKVALSAAPFFASGYSDQVCVSGISGNYSWAQPILIMQSRYDFAMLNSWDGKLTLDEENGTILSAMLGAGRKNEDNTFSGVLIGDIQRGTGLNEASTLTGVYGLHEGVLSYQLTEDGKATFGKKGHGQILLDGNESTIRSAEYSESSNKGTLIDLDDGIIDMKFPQKGRVLLSSKEAPYFLINSTAGNPLINIGLSTNNTTNFIQSDANTQGSVFLDLTEGSLDIKSNGILEFLVDSTPEKNGAYFKIAVPSENETAGDKFSNNLFYLSKEDFYLQSKSFNDKRLLTYYKNSKAYGNYYQYNGSISFSYPGGALNKGSYIVVTITGHICYALRTGDQYSSNGIEITFNPYKFNSRIQDNDGNWIPIETTWYSSDIEKYIKNQSSPIYSNSNPQRGFKLDLNNSQIIGYDLYLSGVNINSGKSFLLDSGAPTYPFLIGNNFKIDWDGNGFTNNLYCNNLTVTGYSNIGGNTSIDLGSFHISSDGSGSGYWGGQVAGVAGYGGVPLSSLASALSWTVYVKQ